MNSELNLKVEIVPTTNYRFETGLLGAVGRYIKMGEKYFKLFGAFDTIQLKLGTPGSLRLVFVNGTGRYLFLRTGSSDMNVAAEIVGSSSYTIPIDVLERNKGKEVGVIDLGANVGISGIVITDQLLRSNIDHVLVAVEPFKENTSVLRRNLSGHRFIIIEGAVDHTCTEVGLCIPNNRLKGSSLVRTNPDLSLNRVPSYSVSEIIKRLKPNVPLILKVDIEGAEDTLFKDKSITSILQRCEVVFIENHTGLLEGLSEGYFDLIDQTLTQSGLKQSSSNMRDRVYVR